MTLDIKRATMLDVGVGPTKNIGGNMTRLTKPVTRVVDFGRGPVAITMDPSGLLAFRYLRGRKRYYVPIGAAFVQAVARTVAAEKAAKRAARKAARS